MAAKPWHCDMFREHREHEGMSVVEVADNLSHLLGRDIGPMLIVDIESGRVELLTAELFDAVAGAYCLCPRAWADIAVCDLAGCSCERVLDTYRRVNGQDDNPAFTPPADPTDSRVY